jgi:Arc/MetJ-type ribon-helix-helix transcriptional regulator
MIPSSEKRQISVAVDAQLLDEIDKLANESLENSVSNRSNVVEEALRLWYSQKIKAQLAQFYQNRSPDDIETEEDWAKTTQDDAMAAWNEESL